MGSSDDGQATLLVVEDDYLVRWALATEAREQGYRVREADALASARAAIAEGVDVVLLDCLLPDGDGMSLLTEIARDRREVPVIVMTADGSVPQAVEAMQRGAFHYVKKPVEPTRAIELAGEALARRTGANGGDGRAFLLPEQGIVLDEVERSLLAQALERTGGNRSRAARLLGITRNQLRYRIKKFDLDLETARHGA